MPTEFVPRSCFINKNFIWESSIFLGRCSSLNCAVIIRFGDSKWPSIKPVTYIVPGAIPILFLSFK